ncbi:hypothetical protein BCR32DRAFT_268266 [Anaeromyces robustus]|uniref:3'-5' exonuclease domain-containing protein n=1 Tax=Anaeromyces robustus TaxID=1754192 RepID=A0A1Y1X812_9FUNG|nr:hypothetical protein BCR32DRAFT_268266 [Anaeromyces robustus]|eukprot:ORX81526.1 hypothetical protein BCR32DRAFT_268266 [Anaeromyces robustus]
MENNNQNDIENIYNNGTYSEAMININEISIKDYVSLNNKIFSYEDRIVRNDNFNSSNLNNSVNFNNYTITSFPAQISSTVNNQSTKDYNKKNENNDYKSSFTSYLPKLTSLVPPSFNSPLFGETLPQIPTLHPQTHKTLHYLLKNCGVQKVADVPCTYLAQTCEEANVLAEILKHFKEIRVLGFDTETTVFRNHMKGAVSLIQIAPTEDICLLFQVYRMCAYPIHRPNNNKNGGESTTLNEHDGDNSDNNNKNFFSSPEFYNLKLNYSNDTFYDEDYTKYNNYFNSNSPSVDDENELEQERIWDINQFPYHLKDILTKKSIIKVGVNSIGDADLLKKWYNFEMKGVIDLQLLAHGMKLPVESLSSLSYLYTGQLLEKDGGIKKMKFDKRHMKLDDIIYSARDAVMGLAIFNRMVRPPLTFPDKLPVQRRKDNKKKNKKKRISDSLYQNNFHRMKKFSNNSNNNITTPTNGSSSLKNVHSFIDDNTVVSSISNDKNNNSIFSNPKDNLINDNMAHINPLGLSDDNNNRRMQRKNNPLLAKYSLKVKTIKNKNIDELSYNHFLKQKLKQLIKNQKTLSPESFNTSNIKENIGNNENFGHISLNRNSTIPSITLNEDYVECQDEIRKALSFGVKISQTISPKRKIVNDLAEYLKKVYPANCVVNSEKIVSIMKNAFGYNTHFMVEQRKKRYIYEMVRRLIDSGKFIVNYDNDVVVKKEIKMIEEKEEEKEKISSNETNNTVSHENKKESDNNNNNNYNNLEVNITKENINNNKESHMEEGELTDTEEDRKRFEIQQQQKEEEEKLKEQKEIEKERQKRMEFQNKLMDLIEDSITEDNNNCESSHVPLRLIALTMPDTNNNSNNNDDNNDDKDSRHYQLLPSSLSVSEFSNQSQSLEINEALTRTLLNGKSLFHESENGSQFDEEMQVHSSNENEINSSLIISKILSKKTKKNKKFYEDLYEKEFMQNLNNNNNYNSSNNNMNKINSNSGYKSDSYIINSLNMPKLRKNPSVSSLLSVSPTDEKQSSNNTDDDEKFQKKEDDTNNNNSINQRNKKKKKRKNSNNQQHPQHRLVKRVKTRSLSIYDSL